MVRFASPLIRGTLLAAAGLALLPGCTTLRRHGAGESTAQKAAAGKPGTANQVLTTWRKQVLFGKNPVSNQEIVGLSGRLYLFDASGGHPVLGEGKVTIELYDDSQRGQGGPAKLLEIWNFDAEHFKQLAQRDALGHGYTLTLPWSTYRPDVSQVHLEVKYEPKEGALLTTSSQVMTLEHDPPEAQLARKRLGGPQNVIQASASQ